MNEPFLKIAASDAITAFVSAKLAGDTDQQAGAQARAKLEGDLLQAFDDSPGLQPWKPLAMPLSDLVADGQGLDLPLMAPSSSHSASSGDWTWTLTADASMHLVADVLDPEQLKSLDLAALPGHELVRYGLRGEIDAGASGGATVGAWTLNAGAAAKARAAVEWYVAAASNKRLGLALVEAVPFLALPMGLAAQLDRAGDFEYWGSTVEIAGDLSTAFGAEAAVSASGWTWGFDGQQAKLGFTLGVSGSATFKLGGRFRLRCLVKEAGTRADSGRRFGIEVSLERLRTDGRKLALALSAGLDATALAQSADRWLRSHIPDPDQLDPSLELLTNPGTAIADRLRAGLETAFAGSGFKDLVLLAAGFGDQNALAKTLAERAAAPLTDEIDKLTGRLDAALGDSAALVDRWLDRVFGGLPIAADAKTRLTGLVQAQLTDAQAQVDQALGRLAGRIQDGTVAMASKVLAPFASLGELIQRQLQGIAAGISASQASVAVREGLKAYADLRQRVLTVLGDAQRAKLTLALAGTLEQTQSSQTFFRATFVQAADLAAGERLFQALWSGRLDRLLPLLADARASGVIFGEPEGWLLAASQRVSSLSLTINLFGTSITDKVTRTSDLQLKADLAGDVIASGKASAEEDVANYWTERHATLSLSVLRNGSAQNPVVDFAVNGAYSARGRDIDTARFNAMQRTLLRVSGGNGAVDIRALLGGPDGHSMDDKAFLKNVAFLLPMSLQPGEFDAFLDADEASLKGHIVVFGLRALDAEFEGDDHWKPPPTAFLQGLAGISGGGSADRTPELVGYLNRFPLRWNSNASDMSSTVYEDLGIDPRLMIRGSTLHTQLGTLYRLASMARAIVDLQTHGRELRELIAAARLDDLVRVEKAASKRMTQISDTLGSFAVASHSLIGNSEMVSWPFATFAATLAKAVGRPVPPGFVACAVLPGKDDQPIPLIAA